MRRFLGFCVAVTVCLSCASAYGVDSIGISGDALDLGSAPGASPFAAMSVIGLGPSAITLDPSDGESVISLTIQAFNTTGVDWDGAFFELDGGTFDAAPASFFGGPAPTIGSGGTTATLDLPLNTGGLYVLTTEIGVATEPVVLSLTPIAPIPSPGSLAVCVLGAMLLPGRRLGRG